MHTTTDDREWDQPAASLAKARNGARGDRLATEPIASGTQSSGAPLEHGEHRQVAVESVLRAPRLLGCFRQGEPSLPLQRTPWVALTFIVKFCPETKGRTLEELEDQFREGHIEKTPGAGPSIAH